MSETVRRPNSRKMTARRLAASAALVLSSAALAAPQILDSNSRDDEQTELLSPEEILASDLTDVKTIETPNGTSILTAHKLEHNTGTDTILALQLELEKQKQAPDFVYVDGLDATRTSTAFRRMPKDIKPITRSDGIKAIPMQPDNSGEWDERVFLVPRDHEVQGDPARAFETKFGDVYVEARFHPVTKLGETYTGESFVDSSINGTSVVIFPEGLAAAINQPVLEDALPR